MSSIPRAVKVRAQLKPVSSCWRVLFFCELACFMPNDEQNIRRSLARAFDRAWDGYYRSGRLTVSQDVARTELARRLVQLSKEGVRDEGSLTKAGLSHLRQLTLKGGKTEQEPLAGYCRVQKLGCSL